MNYDNLSLLIRCAREYGHRTLKEIGLSDTGHRICVYLYAHSGVSQDDVANALRLDRTTASRALLSLEEKGFVRRQQNPENRRKNLLYLSDSGRDEIADVVALNDRWLEKVSSCLTAEEKALFDGCLKKLLSCAEKIIPEENH